MAPIALLQYMMELGMQRDSEMSWVVAAVALNVHLSMVKVAQLPLCQHGSPFACHVPE